MTPEEVQEEQRKARREHAERSFLIKGMMLLVMGFLTVSVYLELI